MTQRGTGTRRRAGREAARSGDTDNYWNGRVGATDSRASPPRSLTALPQAANMSTVEAGGQREEGEYGRAAKRLKMEEPPLEEKEDRAEDELEEGEDSDSGSLPGNGEAETDSRARWSGRQFGSGRKVRRAGMLLPKLTEPSSTAEAGMRVRVASGLLLLCVCVGGGVRELRSAVSPSCRPLVAPWRGSVCIIPQVDGVSIQASRLRGRAQKRRYLAGSLAFTGEGRRRETKL